VRALLAEEPALSALELVERTGCSERHAMNVSRQYFVQHPEQKAALPVHLTAGARIEALLAEEPALPTGEVAARIGCCRSLVTRVRAQYFAQHPEQQAVFEQQARSAKQQ